MFRRLIFTFLALAGSLSLISTATAGGWAVAKIDKPLVNVVADQPISIGFSVLQHGVTPFDGATPKVTAIQAESGTTIEVDGVAEGKPGHYVADLTFTEPGRWKLHVEPLPFPTQVSLPTITVLEKGAKPASANMSPPKADNTSTISIANFAFTPSRLEVKAGTTVTWINDDSMMHEVAFIEDTVDDAGILAPGESFSFTFTAPGTYNAYCGPHPGMSGTIVVS
jgi:plastocyanin